MLLSEWRNDHHGTIKRICEGVYIEGGYWSAEKLGIDREDFAQNILLEFQKMDDCFLKAPKRFTETVAKRRKLDLIRKANKTKEVYTAVFESEPFNEIFFATYDQSHDEVVASESIERLRFELSERECGVLLHKHQRGLSIEETAEILGVSVSSVKRDLRRIRELAPRYFNEHDVAGDNDLSIQA